MKKILLVSLITIFSINSVFAQKSESSKEAIRQVVESFRQAIIEKDKKKFVTLLFAENITWQAVMEDESLARIKQKRPQAIKARFIPENNPMNFIDSIVNDSKPAEEKFSNVKIITDGDAASVSFDYIYFEDRLETNRGKEMWLLVRTEQGWKITSVIYSIKLPKPKDEKAKKP